MTSARSRTSERVFIRGGYYYHPEHPFADDEPAQRGRIEQAFGFERLRRLDPLCLCALYAVKMARVAAGIPDADRSLKRKDEGVCIGTGFGAQTTRIRFASRLGQLGPAATNPIDFPDSIDGAPAAHIAIHWGLRGPSLTFVEGTASAGNALVAACRQISAQQVKRMVLVSGDIFDPWLRHAMASASEHRDAAIDVNARKALDAGPLPIDAVLAFILEPFDPQTPSSDAVEVVGFQGHAFVASRQDKSLFRDVTTPRKDPSDFSGTSLVAGAWIGVTAPVGNSIGSWQDDSMIANGFRCGLGIDRFPHLAFVRHTRLP